MNAVYAGNADTFERYADDQVKFVSQSLLDSEWYRDIVKKSGGTKILSVGLWGFREHFSDRKLEQAISLGITNICPLILCSTDTGLSSASCSNIEDLVNSTDFRVCPILVGADYEGLKETYSMIIERKIPVGAIGFPVTARGDSESSPDAITGFGRFDTIRRLVEDQVFALATPHWLYGSYNPAEFSVYNSYFSSLVRSNITRGITGAPYTLAVFGATMSPQYGTLSRDPIRLHSDGPVGLGSVDVYEKALSREQMRSFALNRELTSRFLTGGIGEGVVDDFVGRLEESYDVL